MSEDTPVTEEEAPGRRRHRDDLDEDDRPTGPAALEVRDLVKEFPVTSGAILQRKVGAVHAVSGVSFSVEAGQTFGLVGESGCGKTTVGRLITGLETATSGSLVVDGEDFLQLSKRERRRSRQGHAHRRADRASKSHPDEFSVVSFQLSVICFS